jgi:hypothetical protein
MSRLGTVARSAAVAAIGVASLGSVALAQDTVTQEITQGAFTASVADATLSTVAYSNTAVTSNGVLTLTAEDSRGVGTGWTVTISSSDFDYQGSSPLGEDIPVTGFQTTGFGTVSVVAGQADPLPTVGTGGTFSSAVTVLEAASGAGSGIYTAPINVSLDIPAESQAGTYVADLTVTIVDGNQP